MEIRRLKKNFTANELIGFNNTGNICVWPSEECLAYYLLKNRQLCRNRRVLELGGGMSCLAGMMVAKYCDPKEIALTDGNVTSVSNVRRIIARNGMTDFVDYGVVQWAKAARAIRAARSVRMFVHPHPNGLRIKVNSSSRVFCALRPTFPLSLSPCTLRRTHCTYACKLLTTGKQQRFDTRWKTRGAHYATRHSHVKSNAHRKHRTRTFVRSTSFSLSLSLSLSCFSH